MSFSYEISKEHIIQETPNKLLKLSWIKWGNSENEKIDIRNWYEKSNLDSSEMIAGKGVSLDVESANELTNALIENDFGDIEKLAQALEKRCEIKIDIPEKYLNKNIIQVNESENDKYIDPNEILDM